MKQEIKKDITKLKALSNSEMQNGGSSTYVDGFTFNTPCKIYATLRKNEISRRTAFTIEHDKF
jgi:hypothetical protein